MQDVCRVGYRAPYIVEASRQFLNNEIDYKSVQNLDQNESIKLICKYYGVGNKVANCILLFSGLKRDAFPVDVWVERMLIELYGLNGMTRTEMEKWGKEHFGEYAGIAQQYLFTYIREIGGKNNG